MSKCLDVNVLWDIPKNVGMHVCACICACMRVCVYICVSADADVCLYLSMCVCLFDNTNVYNKDVGAQSLITG